MTHLGRAFRVGGVALALLCFSVGRLDAQPEAFGYVLFAPGNADGQTGPLRALARVVIDAVAHPCPTLLPGHRPMAPRENPNPTTFPVTVCEAVYPFGQALLVDGFRILLPRASAGPPARIVVLGDSGCESDSGQDCATQWPFGAFAADAARAFPDLVVHVGDYNYRGTPSKVNGEDVYDGCAMSSYVTQNPQSDLASPAWDSWQNWRDDFFRPAAPLLRRAPWIFTRGNHELCSRAGPGYFYFLDPHSTLLGHDPARFRCPAQVNGGDPSPNLVFVPPYALPFGDGLTIVAVDSANSCDEAQPTGDALAIYTAQFTQIPELIQTRFAWLATHRPIWGVDVKDEATDCSAKAKDCLNAVMQQAIQATPAGALPPSLRLLVSGHMHRFEALNFDAGSRPPQLVVGASGVALEGSPITTFTATNLDGQSAHGVQLNQHGYMSLFLSPDDEWVSWLQNAPVSRDSVLSLCGSALLARTGTVCWLTGK